jgi:hypothetical protein
MSYPWTEAEDAVLEEFYAQLGARGCETKLQRSYDAIMSRAAKLGIRYEPTLIVKITEAQWWELIPGWRAAEPANNLTWRIAA